MIVSSFAAADRNLHTFGGECVGDAEPETLRRGRDSRALAGNSEIHASPSVGGFQ